MRIFRIGGLIGVLCAACALNGAEALSLPTAPRASRIRLRPLVLGAGPAAGMWVHGSVNGGPSLRLLLDSGSQYVVLKRKAAIRSGCQGAGTIQLVGAGSEQGRDARLVPRATIEVGGFVAREVPVLVSDRSLADGIDGVLPLALFSDYLIRVDFPAKNLELQSLPEAPDASATRVRVSSNLLFVSCRVNGHHNGMFLLDTGAAYTVISRSLAEELADPDLLSVPVSLRGGVADVQAHPITAVTSLLVGKSDVTPVSVVALDLSSASRRHNFEILGLLGFSALRDRVLLVNYRDSQLRIEH